MRQNGILILELVLTAMEKCFYSLKTSQASVHQTQSVVTLNKMKKKHCCPKTNIHEIQLVKSTIRLLGGGVGTIVTFQE